MGCICSKPEDKGVNRATAVKKTYSWDEKKKFANAKNFLIENLDNQEEVKLPGSVNGEQFIIQNCKDSTIYILDYINTISIDDCINCNIVLGPIAGSAFIRNCKSCTCVIACGQFRMRDSTKINIFLFSATQPIIEASSGIYFGTYQLKYNNIQNHFHKANLNTKDRNWRMIYDFTPMECKENWNFLRNDKVEDYISELKSEMKKNELSNVGFSWTSNELCFNQTQIID